MSIILDGKKIAEGIKHAVKEKVDRMVCEGKRVPSLTVLLVGEDPASQIYVSQKEKAFKSVGMSLTRMNFSSATTEQSLVECIGELNGDSDVDGILVQLPLPSHINSNTILSAISPLKDVDGFHPQNMGNLLVGNHQTVACTPLGILHLLKEYGIELEGKKAVVVGRSNIVGKPMALLLLEENASVTICHGKTADLKSYTLEAEILVVAIGKPQFITGDMIRPGAVVIDVGINRTDQGIVGDVDFESARDIASYITPVPGGIGPMTIVTLLENTFEVGTHNNTTVLKKVV